ncbi:alcohol dehydrogenase catalytic domain-containing protein [Thalassolituus sp. LLYu03]|uniref:alcohol dehydrogenase catalytic domain-containing protein n=1 Tax=Thalassolituus sp. LLYu03 TaxID=3421656 RepID=UPI003D27C378
MMMKAWRMTQTGSPDVLQLSDVERPQPGAGQVLIRVMAAGFNPIDTKIRAGIAAIAPESGVIGCDVSGIVEALGEGVSEFNVGDAVFGCAGGVKGHSGALAEFMVADAALLAPAPASISLAESATLPIAALTADAVLKRLNPQAGDAVFVVGASGAVGLMACQMANLRGCRVAGSAGTAQRLERVREFGAEACLHADIAAHIASGTKYPFVLDTFGTSGLQSALGLADVYGQVATINARGQHELALAHAKSLTLHAIFILLPLLNGVGRPALGQALREIAAAIDGGKLAGLPVEVVGMSQVRDVHTRYEQGMLPDKVVMLADF